MSKDIVEKQIKKDPTLIIDTSEVQATCLFCPYTEDRPTRWFRLNTIPAIYELLNIQPLFYRTIFIAH